MIVLIPKIILDFYSLKNTKQIYKNSAQIGKVINFNKTQNMCGKK